eukprot:4041986-Prymnesium_polylepis.1
MAYVHYAGSPKKKLTYSSICSALGEEEHELSSLHGIRWRESSHRSSKNLMLSWHARTTDLLEEASTEIGLKLTPLSPPDAFINLMFEKKTADSAYGTGNLTFVLKVTKHLGKTADGVNMYQAKYMRVLKGRTCRGEVETFNQGDLLAYLLDMSGQAGKLLATKAGALDTLQLRQDAGLLGRCDCAGQDRLEAVPTQQPTLYLSAMSSLHIFTVRIC